MTNNEFLEKKIRQQLSSKRIGYLLGAGSSYLDNTGYPLASSLWDKLKEYIIDKNIQNDIQNIIDKKGLGLEATLDLLDDGGTNETSHRHLVTRAIAHLFVKINPPLDIHIKFLQNLKKRSNHPIKIFSLNYDPLIEWSSERALIRTIDGFIGFENSFFNASIFDERIGRIRGRFYGRQFEETARPLFHLIKLHGSMGWTENTSLGIRRISYKVTPSDSDQLLMVPPQRRKATDTMVHPYSALWSEFRGCLSQSQTPLNRLATFGYGFADEHVNAVIENALGRSDFTLMVFSRSLPDHIWKRYSIKENVILVTRDRTSIYGVEGSGHPTFWKFENITNEV